MEPEPDIGCALLIYRLIKAVEVASDLRLPFLLVAEHRLEKQNEDMLPYGAASDHLSDLISLFTPVILIFTSVTLSPVIVSMEFFTLSCTFLEVSMTL